MRWLLLGICMLGVFVVLHQTDYKKTDAEYLASKSPIPSSTNEEALRAENLQLKQKIAKLTDELARLKRTSNISSAVPVKTAPYQANASASTHLEQADIESQLQEFNSMLASGKNPITDIKNNFSNEAVDNLWASQHQHQLENFFTESFVDIHPQYIECRSTRCRITIPVSDQKKNTEISQTLMQGIFNNNAGISKKIVIEPTTNDGTLNFYLARSDGVNLLQ